MKTMEDQVRTDQNDLRDKIKAQATQAQQQFDAIEAKFGLMHSAMENQALLVQSIQTTMTGINLKLDTFIAQQNSQTTAAQTLAAAAQEQQTEMLQMMRDMKENTAQPDKIRKVAETS